MKGALHPAAVRLQLKVFKFADRTFFCFMLILRQQCERVPAE